VRATAGPPTSERIHDKGLRLDPLVERTITYLLVSLTPIALALTYAFGFNPDETATPGERVLIVLVISPFVVWVEAIVLALVLVPAVKLLRLVGNLASR
jgi:hypothetical protein